LETEKFQNQINSNVKHFLVEKLPDFADDKKEENEDDDKVESDVEEAGEEPAGHDRQDSNQADECKNKPMTTEQEDDEKPNEKNEDKGTEFDGLQVHFINILCTPFSYKSILRNFSLITVLLCNFM